ncbi:hypothetical protein FA95DRAFT_1575820 [Auriscalpium vulgare]|uniref:Uncharacterized protein n=1 Tax=Auriscalpium vulgare TaxID=40419 RepID=A0ACB8REL0_9AGAM|nr:hypothetical protein FA95DRAFT_1575820 [Auriscalpium vulgare]
MTSSTSFQLDMLMVMIKRIALAARAIKSYDGKDDASLKAYHSMLAEEIEAAVLFFNTNHDISRSPEALKVASSVALAAIATGEVDPCLDLDKIVRITEDLEVEGSLGQNQWWCDIARARRHPSAAIHLSQADGNSSSSYRGLDMCTGSGDTLPQAESATSDVHDSRQRTPSSTHLEPPSLTDKGGLPDDESPSPYTLCNENADHVGTSSPDALPHSSGGRTVDYSEHPRAPELFSPQRQRNRWPERQAQTVSGVCSDELPRRAEQRPQGPKAASRCREASAIVRFFVGRARPLSKVEEETVCVACGTAVVFKVETKLQASVFPSSCGKLVNRHNRDFMVESFVAHLCQPFSALTFGTGVCQVHLSSGQGFRLRDAELRLRVCSVCTLLKPLPHRDLHVNTVVFVRVGEVSVTVKTLYDPALSFSGFRIDPPMSDTPKEPAPPRDGPVRTHIGESSESATETTLQRTQAHNAAGRKLPWTQNRTTLFPGELDESKAPRESRSLSSAPQLSRPPQTSSQLARTRKTSCFVFMDCATKNAQVVDIVLGLMQHLIALRDVSAVTHFVRANLQLCSCTSTAGSPYCGDLFRCVPANLWRRTRHAVRDQRGKLALKEPTKDEIHTNVIAYVEATRRATSPNVGRHLAAYQQAAGGNILTTFGLRRVVLQSPTGDWCLTTTGAAALLRNQVACNSVLDLPYTANLRTSPNYPIPPSRHLFLSAPT